MDSKANDNDLPDGNAGTASALSFEEDTSGGLGRHLGVTSTTLLIIGRIVGTGIFSTPASITSSAGSVGAALLLWTAGLFLAYAGVLSWLELGTMLPRSGAELVYLQAAYTRPKLLATVVYSTRAIILGFTASGCIVFASNIVLIFGHTSSPWQQRAIASGAMLTVTCIHAFVPKTGIRILNILGSLKIFILLFIVATGFVVLSGMVNHIPDPHASFRNAFAGSAHSANRYSEAMFKVIYSYAGWNNAAYALNEVKRPIRTLKVATPLALSICGILYILANIAYFAVGTPEEIVTSGVAVAPFFAQKVFGPPAKRAIAVFVALSGIGQTMAVTFSAARLNQELAKEGVVPFGRFWASSWPTGSPSAGLLLHLIPSLIVILAIPPGDAFNFILDLWAYPTALTDAFVIIGLFVLRFRQPNLVRPFKVWSSVAIFFLATQGFLLVTPFIRSNDDTDNPGYNLPYWLAPIIGILILIVGAIYWFWWRIMYPVIGGFQWISTKTSLKDGTVVTVYKKEKIA